MEISESHFLLAHISPQGIYDGFIVKSLENVFEIKYDGKYEKKISNLYQLQNQSHKKVECGTETLIKD